MYATIQNTQRICGYNQAARYFEETRKPRTARWGEDERPLYNTRSHHYRIVKGEEGGVPFYDLVLYSTSMIRYYEPTPSNEQRVLVRGHSSTTSRAFLWRHGMGMGRLLNVVDAQGGVRDGKLVLNPETYKATDHGVPHGWSADLMFTDDSLRTIDVTRSRHIPIYKAATSDEDKATRKQLKQAVDPWVELLGYRLEEYLNTPIDTNKWQLQRAGEAFTSAADLLSFKECNVIREAMKCAMVEDKTNMESEAFTNAMTKLGHAVATHLKGVRENQARGRWNYITRQYDREPPKPVTRADFRKSMESHLISLLNLREGSARVDIGQFPEAVPRKWWC